MAREREVELSSMLSAKASTVWSAVSTMAGVNYELSPFIVMTAPEQARGLDLGAAPTGVTLFRSWLLLFGVLPIDYDDLQLQSVTPGVGFVETSTLMSARTWRHERTIDPCGDHACRILDRLLFEPRVPFTGALIEAAVRSVFQHRHRRLRRKFGDADRSSSGPTAHARS